MLTVRLSQLLVAFTIECDNEYEHRMPHRTTVGRGGSGPWLISMMMWANYLRLVPEQGIPLRELAGPTGVPKLSGLQRWGYLVVEPDPDDPRPLPPAKDWWVWPTRAGLRSQRAWQPLGGEIEDLWRQRHGADVVHELRESLLALTSRLEPGLPRYMPVLGYGLRADAPTPHPGPPPERPDLSVLLSQVLTAYTQEFETESRLGLALCLDVLRLVDPDGVPVGELPLRGGVSKEAVAMAVGLLQSADCFEVGGRPKLVRLTSKGSRVKQRYELRLAALDLRWRERFGGDVLQRIEAAAEVFVSRPNALTEGLTPYPDGWRAAKPYSYQTEAVLADPFGALPHHPMVLHRGGYPDGS